MANDRRERIRERILLGADSLGSQSEAQNRERILKIIKFLTFDTNSTIEQSDVLKMQTRKQFETILIFNAFFGLPPHSEKKKIDPPPHPHPPAAKVKMTQKRCNAVIILKQKCSVENKQGIKALPKLQHASSPFWTTERFLDLLSTLVRVLPLKRWKLNGI